METIRRRRFLVPSALRVTRSPAAAGGPGGCRKRESTYVVGGGLIDFEVCDALRLAGIDTTVIEKTRQILPFLDPDLAKLVERHVRAHGPGIIVGNGVAEFLGEDGRLTGVKLDNGTELPCELAVVAVGIRANVGLAQAAGIAIGEAGRV